MSTPAEKSAPDSEVKRSTRRRRPNGGRGPRKAPAEGAAPKAPDAAPRETTPRAPRPPSVPVPESLLGKKATGIVATVVKKGRYNFGFITLGAEGDASAPTIYFNPTAVVDTNLFLRKGYEVELVVGKDEDGRTSAKEIKLTAAGEKTKVERDAAFEARRAERAAAPAPAAAAAVAGGEEDRKPRVRKPRPPAAEGTPLSLKVTCQGHAGEKTVDVHNLISVGRLKGISTTAFEAPVAYNVYHVPKDGSAHVFLTKAVLSTLSNGDKIHLAEPKETTA